MSRAVSLLLDDLIAALAVHPTEVLLAARALPDEERQLVADLANHLSGRLAHHGEGRQGLTEDAAGHRS